jgi:hypothetical protein
VALNPDLHFAQLRTGQRAHKYFAVVNRDRRSVLLVADIEMYMRPTVQTTLAQKRLLGRCQLGTVIAAREQMAVGVCCHLYRGMPASRSVAT